MFSMAPTAAFLVAAHGGQGFGVVAQEEVLSGGVLCGLDAGGHGQTFQGQGASGEPTLQIVHDKDAGPAGRGPAV